MFEINDTVMYKFVVCKIKESFTRSETKEKYFSLRPIFDPSSEILIPISNLSSNMRNLITPEKANELFDMFESLEIIDKPTKFIESEYRKAIVSTQPEDLLKVIKTTKCRIQEKSNLHLRRNEKDAQYLSRCEEYLYPEIAVSLGITIDEVSERFNLLMDRWYSTHQQPNS